MSASNEQIKTAVLIVGAGPTGLTLANVLGQEGIDVIIIERKPATVQEPRAVSIDDESLRTMQFIGLEQEVLKNVVAGYGVHYFARPAGRCFAKVEPTANDYGYPRRNAFRQPLFEASLSEGLKRFPSVRVLFEHTLDQFEQKDHGAFATVSKADGSIIRIHCDYLVACDGGRSTVRKMCDVPLVGSSFESRWLIIDTENDDDPFWQTRVYCDADRPVVDVPGPHKTRRYELMLQPHETDADIMRPERIKELLKPFRGDRDTNIVRKTVYMFHARVAQKWRIGSVFLAGDAAHLTPPYAGQGMNSGVRDAHNLGWKLAAVVKGRLSDRALDSYELERRGHAWALIKLALNLGVVMAPASRMRARLLVAFFTLISYIRPLRDYFLQMKFKPKPRFEQGLVLVQGIDLVGSMLPQPSVTTVDGKVELLDSVIGNGFSLICINDQDSGVLGTLKNPLWQRLATSKVAIVGDQGTLRRPARDDYQVVADTKNALIPLMESHKGKIMLIRPDRYIAGIFDVNEESQFAERYASILGIAVSDPSVAASALFQSA